MEPLAFPLALSVMRTHALSARPDAPVVTTESPPSARPRAEETRRAAATALRRLADRLEPCPRPAAVR